MTLDVDWQRYASPWDLFGFLFDGPTCWMDEDTKVV